MARSLDEDGGPLDLDLDLDGLSRLGAGSIIWASTSPGLNRPQVRK